MEKIKDVMFREGSTDRFGYEWNKYGQIVPEYEAQFLKWIFPLSKKDFVNKIVMDAGCGMGRNSFWSLKYGAKKVISFDYDYRTVDAAKKNLLKFDNSKVFFGSIYNVHYENEFDISFSIGVIHHLKKPREAVKALVKATKKGGIVLIWVYGYEGNEWIVKYVNPLRKITSRLPSSITHTIGYALSIPLYSYIKLFWPKHPYLRQLSNFRFWHVNSIVFDQLTPRIANYWTKEEASSLFEEQGLKNIRAYRVNKNSWTIIGEKV